MVKVLLVSALLFCTVASILGGECNSYEREKLNEGYRTCVYKDSMGIPTIGVGFNLKKFGARSEIEEVGADYDKVLAGTQCLTDSQIETLFNKDMSKAVSCASGFVSNYNQIGEGPQSALADMAFNMGCGTLHTFGKLCSDVESDKFSNAEEDMKESLWCRQVGGRCSRDVDCMKKGIKQHQLTELRQNNNNII